MYRKANIKVGLGLLLIVLLFFGCSNDEPPNGSATPVLSETETNDLSESNQQGKLEEEKQQNIDIKPDTGYMAPNFTFYKDEGEITLEDLQGKPVYLIFWSSW